MAKAPRDLTITEAQAALSALCREINSRASIYPALDMNTAPAQLVASIYPKGLGYSSSEPRICAKGASWAELLSDCRRAWAEHAALYDSTTARAMALAIIEITADLGECSDAALRAKFDAADVVRLGARAVDEANQIASNGPFSIVPLAGANDAQAA